MLDSGNKMRDVLMVVMAGLTAALVLQSTGQLYPDLSSALLSSDPDLDLSVSDSTALSLSSLGLHRSISLACNHSALQVVATVVLPSDMLVRLFQCSISCNVSTAAFCVFGSLEVQDSEVRNCSSTAFLLYGALHLSHSRLSANLQSVVTAQVFGFALTIESCQVEVNSAPLGAVLFLALASSQTASLNLTISASTFTHNSAALLGSVLFLKVSSTLLPVQSRQITISNSRFTSNSGVLCYMAASQLNVSVTNSSFMDSDTAFILSLDRADFVVRSCYFEVRFNSVLVTQLGGQVELTDLDIGPRLYGASVQVLNLASTASGFIHISGIRFQPGSNITWTIDCFNAAITIHHLRASDGELYGAPAGFIRYSTAVIEDVYASNLRLKGALVFSIFSHMRAQDLYIGNVTMRVGGIIGSYFSRIEVHNLTVELEEANYQGTPMPLYGIIVAFNSLVTFTQSICRLPPIANYPALYVWASSLAVSRVSFTCLYSHLITAFQHSQVTISDIDIDRFHAQNLALAVQSSLEVSNVTLHSGIVDSSVLTVLQSSANVSAVRVLGNIQALVVASGSTVLFTLLHLAHLNAVLPLCYLVSSRVTLQQVSFAQSVFDLAEVYSSALFFRQAEFQQISVRSRFMVLVNASVSFEDSSLEELQGALVNPLCLATRGSLISFSSTRIANLSQSSILKLSASSCLLYLSSVGTWAGTFAQGNRANVTVSGSQVEDGGSGEGGFLSCRDCSVSVKECQFSNVTGGVLFLVQSSLLLTNSLFLAGRMTARGGFIYAQDVTSSIAGSQFDGGKATQGGALYLDHCDCTISHSNFSGNWALEGGVLYWTELRPRLVSVLAHNNTAAYGTFEASQATSIALTSVTLPFIIGLFDEIGQLVSTDNTSTVQLVSSYFQGATTLTANCGQANFSALSIQVPPHTNLTIEAFSPSLNQSFPAGALFTFSYVTPLCMPGEVATASGCFRCPEHTFSLNPNDTLCTRCPSYASCPGGNTLVLAPGYWRESDQSAEMQPCPIAEACAGGANSTCGTGYAGVLCARCALDYYYSGLSVCESCESLAVIGVRTFLLSSAALTLYLFLFSLKLSVISTLKILLEFLQLLLILPLINVDWTPLLMGYFAFNEMLLSFGLSSVALECLQSSLPAAVQKAVLASLLPVLLLGLCVLMACVKRKQVGRSFVVALWYLYPYLVKCVLPLLVCRQVNGVWRLIGDVSMPCSEGLSRALPVALPMVIMYVLGLPLGLCLLIAKRGSVQIRSTVSFFLEDYVWHYAAVVTLVCKGVFCVLLVALSAAELIIQILSAVGFLYVVLHLYVRKPSYKIQKHDFLCGYGRLLHLHVTAVSLYFAPSLQVSAAGQTTIASTAFLCIVAYILALIRDMVLSWKINELEVVPASQMPESSLSMPSAAFAPPPSMANQELGNSDSIELNFS